MAQVNSLLFPEGREEEFSDSDPELQSGLYRLDSKNAVFFDSTFKGFANLEFVLEKGPDKAPVQDTIFIDATSEGNPLLVYKKYPYFIKRINIFDHSKNISKRLQESYGKRILAVEKDKYIPHFRFKTGPMLKSIQAPSRQGEQSIHQQLLDLDHEIRKSSLGDTFYKSRRIKNLIDKRRKEFGDDFANNPEHLKMWQKEWAAFQKSHQDKERESQVRKSNSASIEEITQAYKAKGPAQKQMMADLANGKRVPVDPQRLDKYMENLADKYLANPMIKRFADITKGIRRLFDDLLADKKIQKDGGYYILKGGKNG